MKKFLSLLVSLLFISAQVLAEVEFLEDDAVPVEMSKCEKASDRGTYLFTDERDDQVFLYKGKLYLLVAFKMPSPQRHVLRCYEYPQRSN